MIERWEKVLDWPGYSVSTFGRIKRAEYIDVLGRVWKERFLKVSDRCVKLIKNGEYFDKTLAQLILLTFRGPPPDVAHNNACHIDDDRSNNALSNLYWGTKSENAQDAVKNGKLVITQAQREQISRSLDGHEVPAIVRRKIAFSLMNRPNVPRITFRGETLTVRQWADRIGVSSAVIQFRLSRGWPLEIALTRSATRKRCKILPGEDVAPLPVDHRS